MRIYRTLKNIGLILLTALAMYGLISFIQIWKKPTSVEEISSVVVLDRVEKVFKLIAVEGNFSEIYSYKHHYFADIWPFRKQALIRVTAKVMVGYDLENLRIDVDEDRRTVTIIGNLNPEILSIEDDMNYYNFENGLFNVITNQDITDMSARAKDFIEEKALESDLFDQAEEQRKELLDLLTISLEASGWTLSFQSDRQFMD
jgi:hypothetical protein